MLYLKGHALFWPFCWSMIRPQKEKGEEKRQFEHVQKQHLSHTKSLTTVYENDSTGLNSQTQCNSLIIILYLKGYALFGPFCWSMIRLRRKKVNKNARSNMCKNSTCRMRSPRLQHMKPIPLVSIHKRSLTASLIYFMRRDMAYLGPSAGR